MEDLASIDYQVHSSSRGTLSTPARLHCRLLSCTPSAYSLGGTLVQNKAFQEAEVSFNLQTWVTVLSWDFNTTLSYKAHVLTQGENFLLLAVSAMPG